MAAPARGRHFLRRLREGAAAERLPIHRLDVAASLAGKAGIDVERFTELVKNGEAEAAFAKDRRECGERGIRAFPTFLLQNKDGAEIRLPGYVSYSIMESAVVKLAGGNLRARNLDINCDLFDVVAISGSSTAKEISEVFDIGRQDAQAVLDSAAANGLLEKNTGGTDSLYRLVPAPACTEDGCLV